MKQTTPYYIRFLRSLHGDRQASNPSYSLRAFARHLRIDAGTLSLVLNGKKPLTFTKAQKIIEHLDINPQEQHSFLSSVAEVQSQRKLQRRDPAVRSYQSRDKSTGTSVALETYRVIADWYHAAIMEMTFLEKVKITARSVALYLGIPETTARTAIDRLEEFELIEQQNDSYRKTCNHLNTADKTVTTPALKKKQKQIRLKSLEAIDDHPINERVMTTATVSIDPELLPEARNMIDRFNNELCAFLESGKRKEVYIFESSLFSLKKK